MFPFSRDDSGVQPRHSTYRMVNHRHNPYIGTFHFMNRKDWTSHRHTHVIDTKNPNLPMLRHSPQVVQSVGLKGLLFEVESSLKPFVTQVQVSELTKHLKTKKHLTSDALKHLPLSIFDNSTKISTSDDDMPVCSICLDCFKDGDELRTLQCSHIYHRRCIDVWLIGCLSDELIDTGNCPQCRQAIGTSLPQQTTSEIPSSVLLRISQSLQYSDSVSDLTSDNESVLESVFESPSSDDDPIVQVDLQALNSILSQQPIISIDEEEEDAILNSDSPMQSNIFDQIEDDFPSVHSDSTYSDCGVPLPR